MSGFPQAAAFAVSVFLLLSPLILLHGTVPFSENAATGSVSGISANAQTTAGSAVQDSFGSSLGHTASGTGNVSARGIVGFLSERKIPASMAYVPNFGAAQPLSSGIVSPDYGGYPAPMGIADYGLRSSNGRMVAYNLSTSRIEGNLQLSGLKAFYAGTSSPSSVSIQLNAVLNGVTVEGNSSYDYWTQNVALYSSRTHLLSFVDNIWNFSGPTIGPAAFYAHNSASPDSFPLFYYGRGPTLIVQYPFTITLFLQSSVTGGRNALFFNYTVSDSSSTFSGCYDEVIFNSSPPGQTYHTVPEAHFLASGTTRTPIGLLNDIEFIIGGPGGGSTTTMYLLNGSMSLLCSSEAGLLSTVASAYDFGSDSGETSEGVAVAWDGSGQAKLTAGPSILYGMWNASTVTEMKPYSGRITPSNAFLFVSSGSDYSPASASWVPLSNSGRYSFQLPSSNYVARVMLSNYGPVTHKLTSLLDVKLEPSLIYGLYTPLYAVNSAQVSDISFLGNGSATAPYILLGGPVGNLGPEFSAANSIGYPVFSGLMLVNVSYVEINTIPVLRASVSSTSSVALPDVLYDTSHVSIWKAQFSQEPSFRALFHDVRLFPDLTVVNSSEDLVGSSEFVGGFAGIYIYGGTGNYVWGNSFVANETHPGEFGIIVNGSGNTIFNNYFWGYRVPAFSYFADSTGGIRQDRWNISRMPSSAETLFDGHTLSGSIIGTNYQGGNYWWTFDGAIPFNEGGLISVPDYAPLVPPSTLNFTESGLPSGAVCYVVVNSSPIIISSDTLHLYLPDGRYAYSVSPTRYYYPSAGSGVVELDGNHIIINVSFTRFGFLSGHISPLTSMVFIDNLPAAVKNGSFDVPVRRGISTIVVISSGYVTFRENLTVAAGINTSLQVTLLREQHDVIVPRLLILTAVLFATAVVYGAALFLRAKRRINRASAVAEQKDARNF